MTAHRIPPTEQLRRLIESVEAVEQRLTTERDRVARLRVENERLRELLAAARHRNGRLLELVGRSQSDRIIRQIAETVELDAATVRKIIDGKPVNHIHPTLTAKVRFMWTDTINTKTELAS